MKVSLATSLLVASASAGSGYDNWGISNRNLVPLRPSAYHYNEDPTSVPIILSGKKYLTSTEAKLIRLG